MDAMTTHKSSFRHAAASGDGVTGDRAVRWATVAAVIAVAAVAAFVSYWHAVEVVTAHGEPGMIGHLYPVVIDGIIVAASMVLLDAARHHENAPPLAWWLLAAGIAVTLAANVTFGASFAVSGALWAAWPAAAFVGCYELLMLLVRASARRAAAGVAAGLPDGVVAAAADAVAVVTDTTPAEALSSLAVEVPPEAPPAPAPAVPEVVTAEAPAEPPLSVVPEVVPPAPARKRRVVVAKAANDDLAEVVLPLFAGSDEVTRYAIIKAIEDASGGTKIGYQRAERVLAIAERLHRARRVVSMERKAQ